MALALARGEPVPDSRLVDALWAEAPPPSAAHAVQVYVSALRKAGLAIERTSGGYRLEARTDADELDRGVARGRELRAAGRHEEALASLEAALALWRGSPLQGLEDAAFARAEAARLEDVRLAALEEHAASALELGRSASVVRSLEPHAREQPLRERLQGLLMLALYREGRQADALEAFAATRRALDEIGLEPGAELRELQTRILRQDSTLDVEPESLRQRRRLPSPAAALVGRRAEIEDVAGLLRGEARLVTLTGPGGIGKTRLALAAAHDLADVFPDGVWFVALAPLADAAFVEPTVSEALDLRDASLEQHLAGRALLLVLDNFEHVLSAAPLVSRLLERAPGLKALVTSRSRLDLYGEQDYPVPPLEPAEAAELFVERARAARRQFVAGAGVDELCRRFDRLPLALELVAARARDHSLGELLDSAGLDLAAEGPRDLPDRQRTLRSAIAWSERLLGEAERELFPVLGVFAGGFEPDALEAVSPGGTALLPALVDSALVRREADGRLRMLETVRDYALERLEAEAGDTARTRHLGHFAQLAAEAAPKLLGAGDADAHSTLERERDNLRAALAFARDHGHRDAMLGLIRDLSRFWYVHGNLSEGAAWAEAALASPGAPPLLRAQALRGAALLDWRRGELALAEARAQEARTATEEFGEEADLLGPLSILGAIAYSRGDTSAAQTHFEAGAALAERLGRLPYLSIALNNLAGLHYESRNWGEAREAYEASIAAAREQESKELEGFALYGLGAVSLHEGELEQAERELLPSLAIFAGLGFPDRIASCLVYLAALSRLRGDAAGAARLLGAATGFRQAAETTIDRLEAERAEETRAAAIAALGDAAFHTAHTGGAAARDDVVGEVLAGGVSNLSG